ncbi:MAG: sulfotransferase domain-containing protein, partial [Pseudomonadota bacterium]
MKIVDFIIAGSAKSGTTALYNILDQHPGIFMSAIKETNFFFQNLHPNHADMLKLNGQKRIDGWGDENVIIETFEQYQNLFLKASDRQIIGEASPLYLLDSKIPKQIKTYSPDIKIILILRNPSDVAWA